MTQLNKILTRTHEELLLKSHKQDIEIANLLRRFDELSAEQRIKTWFEKASSKTGHPLNSPGSQHSMPSSSSSNMGMDRTSWSSSYGYAELASPCSPGMKMGTDYLPSPSSQFPLSPTDRFSVQELLAYFPDSESSIWICSIPFLILHRYRYSSNKTSRNHCSWYHSSPGCSRFICHVCILFRCFGDLTNFLWL